VTPTSSFWRQDLWTAPDSGERLPRTYQEFFDWFADESACPNILSVAVGQMDSNALSVEAKANPGQPLGGIFIAGNAETKFL
jgi:hypothetical protein